MAYPKTLIGLGLLLALLFVSSQVSARLLEEDKVKADGLDYRRGGRYGGGHGGGHYGGGRGGGHYGGGHGGGHYGGGHYGGGHGLDADTKKSNDQGLDNHGGHYGGGHGGHYGGGHGLDADVKNLDGHGGHHHCHHPHCPESIEN